MQSCCKKPALAWSLALLLSGLAPRVGLAQPVGETPAGEGAPSNPPPSPTDAPAAPAPSSPAPGAPAAPALTPPRVVRSVPPVYPVSHLTHGEHPTVVLKATILADASVADVTVEHSAGEDFDQAAIEAVRQWTFEPASREGVAIASRVGVAVHFELPELGTFDVVSVTAAEPVIPHPHEESAPHASEPEPEPEFGAHAKVDPILRDQDRGNSDYQLDRAVLSAAPHVDGADLLKTAPGMVVTRVEGDAVGHRLMLRGFDADHGQDIELTLDGVPLNQPSHIHGQGYTDLGFVIPEVVKELRVTEGVYDPWQGDFAVAGSATFNLGVEQRGTQLSTSYGSFNTFRELAVWAPKGQPDDTFAAVNFRKTHGFGQNREGENGGAIAQGSFGHGPLKLILHGSAYASRARTANVLRRDDIESGRVGFYDVYPYATAQSQNGTASRVQLSAKLRYLGHAGENAELLLFYVLNDFRLLANYTGFEEVSHFNPQWAGRGDLIEQNNTDSTVGTRARYRSVTYAPHPQAKGTLELGFSARVDQIDQSQNLVQAPQNAIWDKRVDANIVGVDIGGYFDLDTAFTKYVRLKGGVRADLLSYRIDDALQNFIPADRPANFIMGYRRTAAGIVVNPRVVLEVEPIQSLVLSAAYGEGFRSPQMLLLDEGEPAPFAKVHSSDLGARVALGPREQVHLRGTGYYTALSQDIVFDVREGRAQPVGPSQRMGMVLYADARPWSWLLATASVTYVHATLSGPPPRTAFDPNPPLRKGDLLPYVPPWVLRLDSHAEHALTDIKGAPLVGRASLGFTYWARRPLPYSERAAPVSLLDFALRATYRLVYVDASVFNLIGTEYAAMEFSYTSNWDPSAIPSRLPARTIQAGAPRTFLFTLGVTL
ncbi:MAG: TonB family protein [Myxococcales bacterium]